MPTSAVPAQPGRTTPRRIWLSGRSAAISRARGGSSAPTLTAKSRYAWWPGISFRHLATNVEFRPGERRAGGEPVQQVVLGGSREPVEEHLMPRGEVVRSFLAPVTGLTEGSVCGARPLGIDASSRLQRLQVGLGELPPQDCGVEGDLQVVLSVRGDGYPRGPPGARIACMRESAWACSPWRAVRHPAGRSSGTGLRTTLTTWLKGFFAVSAGSSGGDRTRAGAPSSSSCHLSRGRRLIIGTARSAPAG